MLVIGVGIGLVMQVLVLVVQNDAPPENIGVATSTATFFRSVGGAFGVAIFGTIFASRLADQLGGLPHDVIEHVGSGVQLSPTEADSCRRGPRGGPERLRQRAPRRVPVRDGDRNHPLRALLVPQEGRCAPRLHARPRRSRSARAVSSGSVARRRSAARRGRRSGRRARGRRRPAGWTPSRDTDPVCRRGVGIGQVRRRHRPREELEQVGLPAVDVAADVVRVVGLQLPRVHRVPREDAVAEARARSARSAPRSAPSCLRSEPLGTWQYAHAICFPAGARLASKRLCCATSTNGRSEGAPAHVARSLAAISGSVPPTCTVAARRHSGSRHGIGPSSARSSLKTPGP